MKRIIALSAVLFYTMVVFGQMSDSIPGNHFPKHYVSLNPLKFCLFQQAGLSYEYRLKKTGFGVSTGYIYPSGFNFGRLFIAKTVNYGALEFYKGFFLDPQINFYLAKPGQAESRNPCYLSLKGVYKYMFIDSTHYRIWENDNGDYYDYYRKQIDRLNLVGGFVMFGVKHINHHFFVDFNIGPGLLALNHNVVVAGEGNDVHGNTSNVNPPRKEKFTKLSPTFTMNLNFGFTL